MDTCVMWMAIALFVVVVAFGVLLLVKRRSETFDQQSYVVQLVYDIADPSAASAIQVLEVVKTRILGAVSFVHHASNTEQGQAAVKRFSLNERNLAAQPDLKILSSDGSSLTTYTMPPPWEVTSIAQWIIGSLPIGDVNYRPPQPL